MIRHIVAVDSKNGIAKDGVIPWKLEGDATYFETMIKSSGGKVLVASKTYAQMKKPIATYTYVWSHRDIEVAQGEVVHDLIALLSEFHDSEKDVWVIGGASLYHATLSYADELYITRLNHDFACDTFYPRDLTGFVRTYVSEPVFEQDLSYTFERYKKS